MSLKLLNILFESMVDGNAFKAFEDYAVSKAGSKATNEDILTGEDVMDVKDNALMNIVEKDPNEKNGYDNDILSSDDIMNIINEILSGDINDDNN
jgi:hypothetical protein